MASLLSQRATRKLLLLNPNPSSLLRLLNPNTTSTPIESRFHTSISSHLNSPNPSKHCPSPGKPTSTVHSMLRSYWVSPHSPFPQKTSIPNPNSPRFFSAPTPETPKGIDSENPIQDPVRSPASASNGDPAVSDSEAADKVLESLRKATSDLTWSFIALGAAHFGHWTHKSMNSTEALPVADFITSAAGSTIIVLPCALAFLTWQAARTLRLLEGTAKQGKLSPFSITYEASKRLEALLMRARVVTLLCVVAVCFQPFLNNIMK